MSFLASVSAHVKKYLEAASAFALRVKGRLPGYRHTVIAIAGGAVIVVGALLGEESDVYQGVVGLLTVLGIYRVPNRPDPKRRKRA